MEIRVATYGPFATNCYFVYEQPESALMIDAGFLPEGFGTTVREQGLGVQAILITHGHGDHIVGAEDLRQEFSCTLYYPQGDLALATGEFYGQHYRVPQPTALLRGGERLSLCGMAIDVLHVPGHSEGHVAYRIGHALFPGDCLFRGSIGRYDLPESDESKLYRSLRQLMELPDDIEVYPGHGPATTIGQERSDNPFLTGL